jgi:hypothetical protein
MNTIAAILKVCEQKGISLKPVDGQLEFCGPREAINDELIETLRQNKIQLIHVLTIMEMFDGKIIATPLTIH